MSTVIDKVKCSNCTFVGTDDELVLLPDGQEFYKACPNCKTDEYLMDIDELFQRVNASEVYDEGNGEFEYGIHWLDGMQVVEVEWFKTTAEREQAIDKFLKEEVA